MTSNRTIISIGLDDSEVRQKLARMAADTSKTTQALSREASQIITAGGGGNISSSLGPPGSIATNPQNLGTFTREFAALRSDFARFLQVSAGGAGAKPGADIKPKYTNVAQQVLEAQFAEVFTGLKNAKKLTSFRDRVDTISKPINEGIQKREVEAAEKAARDNTASVIEDTKETKKGTKQKAENTRRTSTGGGGGGRRRTSDEATGGDDDDPKRKRTAAEKAQDRLDAEREARKVNKHYFQKVSQDDIEGEAFGRRQIERLKREREQAYQRQITPKEIKDEGQTQAGTKKLDDQINNAKLRALRKDTEGIEVAGDNLRLQKDINTRTKLAANNKTKTAELERQGENAALEARNASIARKAELAKTTIPDLGRRAANTVEAGRQDDQERLFVARKKLADDSLIKARTKRVIAEQDVASKERADLAKAVAKRPDIGTTNAQSLITEEENARKERAQYLKRLTPQNKVDMGQELAKEQALTTEIGAIKAERLLKEKDVAKNAAREAVASRELQSQTEAIVAAKTSTATLEREGQTRAANARQAEVSRAAALKATKPKDLERTAVNNNEEQRQADVTRTFAAKQKLLDDSFIAARTKRVVTEKEVSNKERLSAAQAIAKKPQIFVDGARADIAEEQNARASRRAYLKQLTRAQRTDIGVEQAQEAVLSADINAAKSAQLVKEKGLARKLADTTLNEQEIESQTRSIVASKKSVATLERDGVTAAQEARNLAITRKAELSKVTTGDLKTNAGNNVEETRQQDQQRLFEAQQRQANQKLIDVAADRIVAEKDVATRTRRSAALKTTQAQLEREGQTAAAEARNAEVARSKQLKATKPDDLKKAAFNDVEEERQANERRSFAAKQKLNNQALIDTAAQRVVNEREVASNERLAAAQLIAKRPGLGSTEVDTQLQEEANARRARSTYLKRLTPTNRTDIGQAAAKEEALTAEINSIKQAQLLKEVGYAQNVAAATLAEQELAALTQSIVAEKTKTATLELQGRTAAQEARNAEVRRAARLRETTPADIQKRADNSVQESYQKDQEGALRAQGVLKDRAIIEAKARRLNLENQEADQVKSARQKLITPADLQLRGENQATSARQSGATELARLQSVTAADLKQQGLINATRRNQTTQIQAQEFKELAGNKAFQVARAERVLAEQQYVREQRKTNREVAKANGVGLLARLFGGGGGSGFGGKGPGSGADSGLGGGGGPLAFFGQGAKSVIRYAVPSAVLFGLVSGLRSSIKEARDLERVFALVEGQFQSTFGANAQVEFSAFRTEILKISRETGVAGEELANVGFQLQGAFGARDGGVPGPTIEGLSGNNLRDEQLRAAAEISRVTGLSSAQITDSLTATSLAFDTTFRHIGDITLDLQDRFGVLAKEIIPSLGDIAPVAQAAGFSLEQMATILATAQRGSGQSGSSIAENLGRIIPAINDARVELSALALNETNLTSDFVTKVAGGDISEVFFAIAENFERMSQPSRDIVTSLIGSKREARAFLSVFNDSDGLIKAIEGTANAGDLLAERFAAVQKTVDDTFARLQEKFRQLGVRLFEAGGSDALKEIASILSGAIDAVNKLADAFNKLNDFTGGWTVKLLAAAAAASLINKSLGGVAGLATRYGALPGLFGGGKQKPLSVPGSYAPVPSGPAVPLSARPSSAVVNSGAPAAAAATGGFAKGLAVTLAVAGAAEFYSYIKQVSGQVDEAKKLYASQTLEQLKIQQAKISETKGPFEGGFGSDLKATFRRGAAVIGGGDPADYSGKGFRGRVIEEAIAQKQFETGDRGTQFSAAIGDKDVRAGVTEFFKNQDEKTKKQFKQLAAIGNADQKNIANIILKAIDGKDLSEAELTVIMDQYGTELGQNLVNTIVGKVPAYRKFVQNFLKNKQETAVKDSLKSFVDSKSLNVDNAKAAFDANELGIHAFLDVLDRNIAQLQVEIDAARAGGRSDEAFVKKLREVQELRKTTYSSAKDSLGDLQSSIRDLNTKDDDKAIQVEISAEVAKLKDPKYVGKARLDTAKKIIGLLNSLSIPTAIPEELRALLVEAQLDTGINEEFDIFINSYISAFGAISGGKLKEAIIALATGQAGANVVLAQIALDKAAMEAILATATDFDSALAAVNALAEVDKIFSKILEIVSHVTIPARTTVGKDSGDKEKELADAMEDYAKALVEGDPVKLARLQIQQADAKIAAAAEGSAERVRAQAERIRAGRQLELALNDVGNAWEDWTQAYAAYTGDTIKGAESALFNAQENRKNVEKLFQSGGAGEADLIRADAEVINRKAALRDANLADQQDQYQFLFDMGKITKSQLITYLEGLKQIPDLTDKQIRDIDLQIKRLRDELGKDLQFNLPNNLKLPTLYEARRISQSGSSQAGFVDNRNVNIVLNVNDGSSQQQMMRILEDTIGAPPVVSTGRKIY